MAKIRRNEACPCGSGLKYKKCCLGVSPEHDYPFAVKNFRERLKEEDDSYIVKTLNSVPEDQKLSHRILEVANVFSENTGIPIDEKMINMIILGWNLAVVEESDDKATKKEFKKLVSKEMKEDVNEVLYLLAGIKTSLFPKDSRLVNSYEMTDSAEGFILNVASISM